MSSKPDMSGLSEREQQEVLKILEQFSVDGKSESFDRLLYQDYREIPVNVETFIHDSQYLGTGLTDAEGRFTLYPYWEELLKKIYPDPLKPAQYNTLALTGAIGIGKSTEAVIIGLYELYRMMCLKDPYVYYGIMNIDTISFAVINITLDAAQGVAWDKMQNLLQSSPWFMAHGSLSKADQPVWRPDNGVKIELIYGSQPKHFIGRALYWCLDSDTIIKTIDGDRRIGDLVDSPISVATINPDGEVEFSDLCTVKPTANTSVEYQVELEDGTIIKCTPEHRFMLKDGSYKEAQYLTESDELFDI